MEEAKSRVRLGGRGGGGGIACGDAARVLAVRLKLRVGGGVSPPDLCAVLVCFPEDVEKRKKKCHKRVRIGRAGTSCIPTGRVLVRNAHCNSAQENSAAASPRNSP